MPFVFHSSHSFHVKKYVVIGVGVLVAYKVYKTWKYNNLRKTWNKAGENVVILHQFQRGKYCPNLSPFALKVETYLRLSAIKYEVDTTTPFGVKGKCPWITVNGEEIADSEFIIEKLNKLTNVNLDQKLSQHEKAVLEAVKILVEEHLFWCVITWRYWLDRCRSFMESQEFPYPVKFYLPILMPIAIKKKSKVQGIGRHTPEEIYGLCKKDCETLSVILGDKDYFGGKTPCTTDCAIFGGLSQLMWNAPGSEYEELLKVKYRNLEKYCFRMKEKVFPDWHDLIL